MDIKELLTQVVDGVIAEDEDAAKAAFKQYATHKVKSLIVTEAAAKDKKDKTEDCTTEEDVAADVIDKSNKDD